MRWMLFVLFSLLSAAPVGAGELPDFSQVKIDTLVHTAAGVTRRGTKIDAFVSPGESSYKGRKQRVLLIGGTDGQRESVDAVLAALKWFYTHEDAGAVRELVILSAIPCANPDGVLLDKGDENGEGGKPFAGELPDEKFYQSKTRIEGQYVSRFVELHGAQTIVLRAGGEPLQTIAPDKRTATLFAGASEMSLGEMSGEAFIRKLLSTPDVRRSALRGNDSTRSSDEQWAKKLIEKYCVEPKDLSYISTTPWLAMQRIQGSKLKDFGALHGVHLKLEKHKPANGSELAGLLFQMYREDGVPIRSPARAAKNAVLLAFDKDGKPLPEPPFHNEMSDAVFMNGPLLAAYGAIVKEAEYFDCCAHHQAFIRKLCKRDDGLYRHSPLCEAAWGRGNGFVAMGHALMLERWPKNDAEYPTLLAEFRQHMAALKQHQDYTGTWHQVIDRPESYREFSCTCMIGFAMAAGVRHGWLDKQEYQPCVDRAWAAVKARTTKDGGFIDVCVGTGKQKTLRDYYDREAITGPDARAGAMALMFASEMVREPEPE